MKKLLTLVLLALTIVALMIFIYSKPPATYTVGEYAMAKCEGSLIKGRVIKRRNIGYQLEYDTEIKPILCTPYLWRTEYLVPFSQVNSYQYNDIEYKVGDVVKLEVKDLTLKARVREISANGYLSLSMMEANDFLTIYFHSHIGTNFFPFDRYPIARVDVP